MSLKAIDAQTMVHKVNEVSRIQKNEIHQGQQRLDNAMAKAKDDFVHAQKSVNTLDQTQNPHVKNDEKRHGHGQSKGKAKKKIEDKHGMEETTNLEKHLGSIFDVRI